MDNQNKTLYAIVIGAYSDWQLIGYTSSLKEAVDCCASINYKLNNDGFVKKLDGYDSAYYIAMPNLDGSNSANMPAFLYAYTVCFKKEANGDYIPWNWEDSNICSVDSSLPNDTLNTEFDWNSTSNFDFVYVKFSRASFIDKERAIKIATDELYQELYRKSIEEL